MPENLVDGKAILVQVMVSYRKASLGHNGLIVSMLHWGYWINDISFVLKHKMMSQPQNYLSYNDGK